MAESVDELKIRIRELEKEVAQWKSKVKDVRYGLNWLEIPEAFDRESEDKIPILEEVREKAVDAEGALAETPPHIIIEGDNYHALTCLNYTHRGKIDVIYIDPPYNTGSDGFTYKDKRFLTEYPDGQKVPKDHPLRHSYWLSFMEKRLKLAKNLLSEKGVIFISIDDNEQANLKLLCDKVFGEGNFVTNFVWKSKSGGANDSKYIAIDDEYILCYAKRAEKLAKMMDKYAEVSTSYNLKDEKGEYSLDRLDKQSIRYSDSLNYEIIGPDGKRYWPKHKDPKHPNATWRWSKEHVKTNFEDLVFKNGCVYTKNYRKDSALARNLLTDERFGRTRTGKTDLFDIFNAEVFTAPKPIKLLFFIFSISSSPASLILDFFAGSGTTLHAALKLNAEDGGKRQCILVQQAESENNICEKVTYERNRRVMQGYKNAKGEFVEGLGGHIKYYKTDFVGKHPSQNASDADSVELANKAGCLIALAENTLETVSVPESSKGFWQIYANTETKKRYTCIYHNGDYECVPEFVATIDALRASDKKAKFTVYVFSWNSPDFFENEFDDLKNIEIKAIPKPILEIYKALNG
ncbi:site-specific DNA-methyltransferase [Fibrobacter sp. UWS1]|uniref:site-specific DNA-methyltransferase n=1 Tax=Fibrobacter sp. UWS1 TaxID=1896220 RepID=UPI000BC50A14|nr:site-specific DNA-methyltransferase [Fibrobacter sp. UWS1]PBC67247.1 adenine-specific DNA-methyltransferase [Fibrobacter sp. UWS1]